MKLFDAARWAASSYNEQPWRFIYAAKSNEKTYKKLWDCLNSFNQNWAEGAPVLMLNLAKNYFAKDHAPNYHAIHDLGLAMGNLSIQASKMDIMVHQMAGFNRELAQDHFDLHDGFEPVTMVAMGYTDEVSTDRDRKPVSEIAFSRESEMQEIQS